jgi:hypothetical protein
MCSRPSEVRQRAKPLAWWPPHLTPSRWRATMTDGGDSVMSVQFWPCPGCSRHVKRGDVSCPFCGATASVEIRPTRVLAGRLSRAALFAAGAVGAAIATTACGGKESSAKTGRGGAAPDAMASAGASSGASSGSGSQYAVSGGVLYGGPFPIETEDSSTGSSSGASSGAASAGASSGACLPGSPAPCTSSGLLYVPMYGVPPGGFPVETGASDGPSEVAADAADASAGPTDSSSAADVPSSTPPYGQGPIPGDE